MLILVLALICSSAALKVPRILNGDFATLGQFPWQVGLLTYRSGVLSHCGGAIISEDWILTAAHCITEADKIIVTYNTLEIDDIFANSTVVTKYVIHEDFDSSSLKNDIGLILLDKPITFNYYVEAITLAHEELLPSTKVTVSGYGATSDSIDDTDILRYFSTKTISNEECEQYYGAEIIQDGVVCTEISNPLKNPCKGDGGDPVVVNAYSYPVHVAIFSFLSNFGCESSTFPAGYTRTAYYREWIYDITGV